MRVLIAFPNSDTANPFVKELVNGLTDNGCDVTWDLDMFWNKTGCYDIIHIQWPEYLFTDEIHFNELNIRLLRDRLSFWRNSAKIILTRHNEHPNYSENRKAYKDLYTMVYSYCDGIAHMGPYNIENFKSKHQINIAGKEIIHTIIEHHVYTNSYANTISLKQARRILKINDNRFVILIFGRIRFKEERKFLTKLFKRKEFKDCLFLIPSWLPPTNGKGLRNLFKKIFHTSILLLMNSSGHIKACNIFVRDNETQFYFNSSDVVLVPRLEGLNSGNIMLAFSFKKVAVGPDIGNMAFDLREFGNPIFKPDSIESLISALNSAKKLTSQGWGHINYIKSNTLRNSNVISQKYIKLYSQSIV